LVISEGVVETSKEWYDFQKTWGKYLRYINEKCNLILEDILLPGATLEITKRQSHTIP
jgi:hypothetical protein